MSATGAKADVPPRSAFVCFWYQSDTPGRSRRLLLKVEPTCRSGEPTSDFDSGSDLCLFLIDVRFLEQTWVASTLSCRVACVPRLTTGPVASDSALLHR